MNTRNGIMMPLGALVTAFLTVLVIGTIVNFAQGQAAQIGPAVSQTPTPRPVSTATPDVVVPNITQSQNPNVGGSVTAGSGGGAGGGNLDHPDTDLSPDAGAKPVIAGYPLHLLQGPGADLTNLSKWDLTVTWTTADGDGQLRQVKDVDPTLETTEPVTQICLTTKQAASGPLIYSVDHTPFQTNGENACYRGPFRPDGLVITVTKG